MDDGEQSVMTYLVVMMRQLSVDSLVSQEKVHVYIDTLSNTRAKGTKYTTTISYQLMIYIATCADS